MSTQTADDHVRGLGWYIIGKHIDEICTRYPNGVVIELRGERRYYRDCKHIRATEQIPLGTPFVPWKKVMNPITEPMRLGSVDPAALKWKLVELNQPIITTMYSIGVQILVGDERRAFLPDGRLVTGKKELKLYTELPEAPWDYLVPEIEIYAQTPVYSSHTVAVAEEVGIDLKPIMIGGDNRRNYALLPWAVEDLKGSHWRHLDTKELFIVDHVGKHHRYDRPVIEGPQNQYGSRRELGVWDSKTKRYVIENYVRVDHLLDREQLAWYDAEIEHCKWQISSDEKNLISLAGNYRENWRRNFLKESLKDARKKLELLRTAKRNFCVQHGLECDEPVPQVYAEPEQLALF